MFGKLYRDAYNLFCTDQSPAKVITLYVRVFLEYCHKDRVVKNITKTSDVSITFHNIY